MKQIFDQVLQFLQQGIAAIFKFVQLVWTWSIGEITKVLDAPWATWPIWKQLLFVIVVAAVAWALFVAARELWVAGVRVLAAFASLLGAFVMTLPSILIAGLIALGGLWAINNLNLSSFPTITVFQGGDSNTAAPTETKPPAPTTGQRPAE